MKPTLLVVWDVKEDARFAENSLAVSKFLAVMASEESRTIMREVEVGHGIGFVGFVVVVGRIVDVGAIVSVVGAIVEVGTVVGENVSVVGAIVVVGATVVGSITLLGTSQIYLVRRVSSLTSHRE